MHLWNDYEGKTIADVYSVGSLLRSEGRSALFALTTGPEAPAIIRITESINDEGQMLACWRRVASLNNDNILSIKHFGDTRFEETPVTYAVLECPEASLAELLKERPLTQPEALQVAISVSAALAALHAEDLVHEHIEPANVLAVGETVKLRGDCVRECVVDSEFMTAEDCARRRQQDVQALGELLLRSLTLERAFRPGMKLPAPFDRMIPRALDGSLTLAEMAGMLQPASAPATPVASAVQTPIAAPVAKPAAAAVAEPAVAARLQQPDAAETAMLYQRRTDRSNVDRERKSPLRIAIGLAAVVVFAVLIHVFRSKSEVKPVAVATTASAVQPQRVARNSAPAARPAMVSAAPATAVAPVQPGWYVIAYTFNHQEQAWKRASAILKRYPSLHPQVIAPNGQFLVALGGAMSRDEAENVRSIARRAGMPRDTFVRNYKGV